MKLSIGKKILLGYIPVLFLLTSLSIFTLFRLNQVNKINREITSIDVVVNNTAENLIDILLTQESFGQRYMILKSQDLLSLFQKREEEFSINFQKIKNLPIQNQFPYFEKIETVHSEYKEHFDIGILYLDSLDSKPFTSADSLRKKAFNSQVALINNLISDSKKGQMDKTWKIGEIGRLTFRTVYLVSVIGIILVILIVMYITSGILQAIKTLKTATSYVSKGKFVNLPTVKNRDELGDLSLAFNEMADRLKQLEEIYKDSSPLTRLPGGISIENAVIKNISDKIPFAFCMLDLDNFKPFNDRYGYSRGNSVIKNTAKIIKESCQQYGNKTDFIGHIGGDDFAVITSPDKYKIICNTIIKLFDKTILEFYNPEDRKKGYILSKSRRDEKLSFPIMTISISVVNTEKSYVENYIEVGEIIAELKKYAKSFSKSNMVVDRRGGKKRKPAKGTTEIIKKVLTNNLLVFLSISALSFFFNCTPMKLVQKPVYVPVIKPDNIAILEPHEFEDEINSLKLKILQKDTSFSHRELLIKLFNLYIHFNNPRPDYEKAYILADSLIKDIKLTKKILPYYNWKTIIRQYLGVRKKNDTLIQSMISTKSQNKSLKYENKKQNKLVDSLTSVTIDSLLTVIRKQNEAIEKLKEVDLKLERHRNIFK